MSYDRDTLRCDYYVLQETVSALRADLPQPRVTRHYGDDSPAGVLGVHSGRCHGYGHAVHLARSLVWRGAETAGWR